jgi:hypothetical protein
MLAKTPAVQWKIPMVQRISLTIDQLADRNMSAVAAR